MTLDFASTLLPGQAGLTSRSEDGRIHDVRSTALAPVFENVQTPGDRKAVQPRKDPMTEVVGESKRLPLGRRLRLLEGLLITAAVLVVGALMYLSLR